MDSFGQEHKDLVIQSIWRTIKFQKFYQNEVVFKEGDKSNGKMFVIISGEASVAIKKKINVFEEENKKQQKEEQEKLMNADASIEQPSQTTNKDQSNIATNQVDDEKPNEESDQDEDVNTVNPTLAKHRHRLSRIDKQIENKKVKKADTIENNSLNINQSVNFDISTLGDVVAKLGTGYSFGEKAIMEEGGIRMATIFASQETDALVIMREDFLSIKKMIEQSKRDKIHLLKQSIPGLANIGSWEILEQLGYVFNEQKFLKNDYLSFEGEKSNTLYILVSGQLEVSQSIEIELEASETKNISKPNKLNEVSTDPSKKQSQQSSKICNLFQCSNFQIYTEKISFRICESNITTIKEGLYLILKLKLTL